MTKRDDLFAAILAQPEDDSVRLVFADWLEEQGEIDRALLVHRQIEAAKLPRWELGHAIAVREAEALLAQHGERWRAELPELDGITWSTFTRGFCSSVKAASVAALYQHAAAIAAAGPVDRVELVKLDEAEHPYDAAKLPWLRVLHLAPAEQLAPRRRDSLLLGARELELELEEWDPAEWLDAAMDQPFGKDRPEPKLERLSLLGEHTAGLAFAQRLGAAPWAKRVSTLDIGTDFVDHDTGYFNDPTMRDAGATAIADAKLARVQRLDLTNQRVGSEGLAAIVATMPQLRELYAPHCEVTAVGAISEAGTSIVALDLSENAIGNAGAIALAGAPRLEHLESLAVALCEIGGAGVAAFARAPFWATLRELRIGSNPLGADGMIALVEAAAPPMLHALALDNADLDGFMVDKLAALPWFAALDTLDLSNNEIGDDAAALAKLAASSVRVLRLAKVNLSATAALSPAWAHLARLSLADNPLHAAGLDALVTDADSTLVELDLSNCELTPAAFEVLERARCPKLRRLILARNALTPAMFGRLLWSPICANLAELDVSHCGLKEDVIPVLASAPALPALRVLGLRGHHFRDPQCLELVAIPTLTGVKHWRIDASPWSLPQEVRDRLNARFGPSWWWESRPYVPYRG